MSVQMPPVPLVEGYQLDPVDPVIRSEMDSGPPRARRTFYSRNDKVNVSWLMSDSEMALFRLWFDSDDGAAGGSRWFAMPMAIGEGGVTQTTEARFASIWRAVPNGVLRWKVTATLEIRRSAGSKWDYYTAFELPTLDLDFVGDSYSYFDGYLMRQVDDPFDGLITFTRASTADYVDAAGVTQTAAINQPCLDHDPSTLARLGLRMRKAAAPRAQDMALITGETLMRWARSDEGAFIVEFVDNVGANGSTNQYLLRANNGTSSEHVSLYLPPSGLSVSMFAATGGVNQVDVSGGNRVVGALAKMGAAFKRNDFYATLGGAAGAFDTLGGVPTSLTRLDIGARESSGGPLTDTHIRRIRFFPFRMSNARLKELTA